MPAACLASAAHSARRQYRRLRSPAGGAPAARGGAGPACRCSGPDARTPKCLGASTWGKTGLGGPPGNLTQETRSHLPLSRQVLHCRPPPPAPNAGFTDCTSVRRTEGQARLRHLPSSSSSPQACRLEGSERLSSSSFAPNKGPFGARQTQIKEVIAFIQKSLCVLVK